MIKLLPMDKALVADVFISEETPVTTQPMFLVQKKAISNLFKTMLFLAGISLLIINQVSKDRLAQKVPPKDSRSIVLENDKAILFPFSFIK